MSGASSDKAMDDMSKLVHKMYQMSDAGEFCGYIIVCSSHDNHIMCTRDVNQSCYYVSLVSQNPFVLLSIGID